MGDHIKPFWKDIQNNHRNFCTSCNKVCVFDSVFSVIKKAFIEIILLYIIFQWIFINVWINDLWCACFNSLLNHSKYCWVREVSKKPYSIGSNNKAQNDHVTKQGIKALEGTQRSVSFNTINEPEYLHTFRKQQCLHLLNHKSKAKRKIGKLGALCPQKMPGQKNVFLSFWHSYNFNYIHSSAMSIVVKNDDCNCCNLGKGTE